MNATLTASVVTVLPAAGVGDTNVMVGGAAVAGETAVPTSRSAIPAMNASPARELMCLDMTPSSSEKGEQGTLSPTRQSSSGRAATTMARMVGSSRPQARHTVEIRRPRMMTKAQVSDLGLSVELRGFEPLTFSLRISAVRYQPHPTDRVPWWS